MVSGIFYKYLILENIYKHCCSVQAAEASRLRLAHHLFADDVQRSTCFEPFDLLLVVSMLYLYHVPASISMIEV
jgi:hypothetical protein